jgi:ATP-dependent Lhr-like helicase
MDAHFGPATAAWFEGAFESPTAAQRGAWQAIGRGEHTLVIAPTGSGKTLAAFLSAIDRLAALPIPDDPKLRCRVLYVSPLKALAADVERNLRSPLVGISQAARRLQLPEPRIEVAMRSGDTSAEDRRAFARHGADILITTPESLFLLLTSASRPSSWTRCTRSLPPSAGHTWRSAWNGWTPCCPNRPSGSGCRPPSARFRRWRPSWPAADR